MKAKQNNSLLCKFKDKSWGIVLMIVVCICIVNQANANLAYWPKLKELSNQLGAISALIEVCETTFENLPNVNSFRQLKEELSALPEITDDARLVLNAEYEEGYISYKTTHKWCKQTSMMLIHNIMRSMDKLISDLIDNY